MAKNGCSIAERPFFLLAARWRALYWPTSRVCAKGKPTENLFRKS